MLEIIFAVEFLPRTRTTQCHWQKLYSKNDFYHSILPKYQSIPSNGMMLLSMCTGSYVTVLLALGPSLLGKPNGKSPTISISCWGYLETLDATLDWKSLGQKVIS